MKIFFIITEILLSIICLIFTGIAYYHLQTNRKKLIILIILILTALAAILAGLAALSIEAYIKE